MIARGPSTEDALVRQVLAIVSRIAGDRRTPPAAGPDTPLGEDGFWLDSVDLLEVVLACDEAFGIVFDAAQDLTSETLGTVSSLARAIRRKQASS